MKTSASLLFFALLAGFSASVAAQETSKTATNKVTVTVPVPAPAPKANSGPRFSAGLDDVVKLTKAGVEESVILAFVQSSTIAYRPNAQEIVRLRELGVSS